MFANLRGRTARATGAGAFAVSAVALMAGCSSSSVLDLKVGDCIQLPNTKTAVTIDHTSCSEEHQGEISAVVETSPNGADDAFPGDSELNLQAEEACVSSFTAYVGSDYVTSSLDVSWLVPTEQSWKDGDRHIACVVYAQGDQKLTQSVKDSNL
ncbi:septum formation family protein [Schaalia turicensis]|uniref:septum formation family protein n=1 Tax=Schaalia turicensis TaxID=131111 RepID=UPI002B4B9DA6|nr:septum formation family protein [Schaalia turicensis]